MSQYTRQPDDIMYRSVYLFAGGTLPEFEAFTAEKQIVSYNDTDVVLEVLKKDDRKTLHYKAGKRKIVYGRLSDGKGFWITDVVEKKHFCAHLLLCRKEGSLTRYKLPNTVLKNENGWVVHIPGGTDGIILVGDEYFEKAYTLELHVM